VIDWLAQWPALLAALVVLFGPGLAIGAALRLRGLALWALAPIAGTVTFAVLAMVLAAMGIRWTPLSAGIGCLVVIAVAVVAGFALGPPLRRPRAAGASLLAVGLVVGAVVGLLRLGVYIGAPDAISQSNDAVFHLNALRWIVETGSASSADLSGVTGSSVFYPAAWHAIVSLTGAVSGATIPVAVNVVTVVIVAVIWPLGIALLTRAATGSTATAGIAAALSPTLLAFPMLMVQWGVLYPYLLSEALLPAAVAIVVLVPRWIAGEGPVEGLPRSLALAGVLLLGALGALALSQPATLLAWAILALSFATWWAVPRAVRATGRVRGMLIGATAAAWLVAIALWVVLTRSTTGSHWPPFRGKVAVFADVLLNGPVMLPIALAVSVLMIAGLVVAVRRPDLRWLATGWLVMSGLYIVAAAIGQPWLRRWLLGAWYADPYRLAALAPVTVIPLAAIGLMAVGTWVLSRVSRRREESGRAPASAAAAGRWSVAVATTIAVVGFALMPIVMMPRVTEDVWDAESRYASDDDSWLSPDERELLTDLEDLVGEDARIIGNPSTGTGFGYMLSGRDVMPRTWAHPRDAAWRTISEDLRDAGTDPAVCDALAVHGSPEYVLDFGEGEESPGRFILPGMTDFAGQPGFEFVAGVGDASLWRLTACG